METGNFVLVESRVPRSPLRGGLVAQPLGLGGFGGIRAPGRWFAVGRPLDVFMSA